MNGTYNTCDHCGKTELSVITIYAGPGVVNHSWITVTKGRNRSCDMLSSGVYHFCTDNCCLAWMNDKANDHSTKGNTQGSPDSQQDNKSLSAYNLANA